MGGSLAVAGALGVLEAAEAPTVRRLLGVFDDSGRPYPAGRVPHVGMLGARRARTDIEFHGDPYYSYVSRSLDEEFAAALQRRIDGSDRRAVLLVGDAMTGKSRVAAQAIAHHPHST